MENTTEAPVYDFQHGYNLNYTGFEKVGHRGDTYLSWSVYTVYLRTYQPHAEFKYSIEKEKLDFNEFAFEKFVDLLSEQKDRWEKKIYLISEQIANSEKLIQRNNDLTREQVNEIVNNNKAAKKLIDSGEKKIKSIEKKLSDLYNSAFTQSRGSYITCWFEDNSTGKSLSEKYYFPVMDTSNNTDMFADTRSLNDSLARALAKSVARHFGFSLRIWSRELVDLKSPRDSKSPIYMGLKKIAEVCNATGKKSDANFGWSIADLRQEYVRLTK